MAIPNLPTDPNAATGAPMPPPAPEKPALPSVTITDNGDGTFTVVSADESTESPDEQAAEGTDETGNPVKGIDAALAQAKSILTGESNPDDLEKTFNAQFEPPAKGSKPGSM